MNFGTDQAKIKLLREEVARARVKRIRFIFRYMLVVTRHHHDFKKWLKAGIRSGKFEYRVDYHAWVALEFPEEYIMHERDAIFIEHAKTESFMAIRRGIVRGESARELMCMDPWAAFRFCPDQVPDVRYQSWAKREPMVAKTYASPGGFRAKG